MPGAERTRRQNERFDPIAHVFTEPLTGPATSRQTSKPGGAKAPRPQNAWILYRAWALNELVEKQPELKGRPQSELSKLLGTQWANESPEIRKRFEHEANLQKERHAQEYPDYVFKPQKKEEKEREREAKKKERSQIRETEKLRKELSKALRAGQVPQSMTGLPEGGTGIVSFATADSDIHKYAVQAFDELGPSPPMSQCPSPLQRAQALDEASRAVADGSEVPQSFAAKILEIVKRKLAQRSGDGSSDEDSEAGTPEGVEFNDLSQLQIPSLSCGSVQQPPSTDFDQQLNETLPLFNPDASFNPFQLPAGNLVFAPGLVEGNSAPSNSASNGVLSIPGNKQSGMSDEEFNCELDNPLTEPTRTAAGSHEQAMSEAPFVQPFMAPDASFEHLQSAGKQIGDLLLEEHQASANGHRIIAAEHVPNPAPALSVADSDSSSMLPSPPDSTALVSPDVPMQFDFMRMQPTNLFATCSKDTTWNDMGFSDTMVGIGPWNSTLDLNSNEGAFGMTIPMLNGACSVGSQSSLPNTPSSIATPCGSHYEGGKISKGIISIPGIVSHANSPAQHDNNWLQANFGEQ